MSIKSPFTKSVTQKIAAAALTLSFTTGCQNLAYVGAEAGRVLTEGRSTAVQRLAAEVGYGVGKSIEDSIEECDVSTDKDRVARRDNTTGEIIYDETSQSESENCNHKKYGLPGSSNGDNNPDIFPSGSYLDIKKFTPQPGLTLKG